ncbi:hypothetical protein Pmani_029828 [Petrolisthes manimaculis]|uniref:Uncharacterized protein n=1 Tax=Petrolisthes manimaculis TaxID=1843537 RepID=A0AAE1TU34_9EUCA|nr:hypothetical protein Pmani_029828 [Petrolisthes manimaculis]
MFRSTVGRKRNSAKQRSGEANTPTGSDIRNIGCITTSKRRPSGTRTQNCYGRLQDLVIVPSSGRRGREWRDSGNMEWQGGSSLGGDGESGLIVAIWSGRVVLVWEVVGGGC